jgi:hypothetical protein
MRLKGMSVPNKLPGRAERRDARQTNRVRECRRSGSRHIDKAGLGEADAHIARSGKWMSSARLPLRTDPGNHAALHGRDRRVAAGPIHWRLPVKYAMRRFVGFASAGSPSASRTRTRVIDRPEIADWGVKAPGRIKIAGRCSQATATA